MHEEIKPEDTAGYHLNSYISKGTYGEPSKIKEELEEFLDAIKQDSNVLAITELSDLIGAISGYLEKYHNSISIQDLFKMSEITKRAFVNGHRS